MTKADGGQRPKGSRSPVRVVLITQDEPFFLADSLAYLFSLLPASTAVAGAVLLSPSPYGKREGMLRKLAKSYRIFGTGFVAHYLGRYLARKASGKPGVAQVMAQRGVPVVRLRAGINTAESLEAIRALSPDVLVSIAGNEIFRRPLRALAPKGCLNLHSALLPQYRGLLPSFWVLRFRERFTGVSVFLVDDGVDTGPILVQKRFAIGDMTQEELIRHGKMVGMEAVAEAIDMIARDDLRFIAPGAAPPSYFSFPTAEDVAQFRRAGARFF